MNKELYIRSGEAQPALDVHDRRCNGRLWTMDDNIERTANYQCTTCRQVFRIYHHRFRLYNHHVEIYNKLGL